jgi:hypothetical protein
MATNLEIKALLTNETYKDRVTIAALKKANSIVGDNAASAPAKIYAADLIAQGFPRAEGSRILTQLILDNSSASNAAVTAVLNDDAQVQTRVDTFINSYVAAL